MLLENIEPQKFLGVGSIIHFELDRDVALMLGCIDRKLIQLYLKKVIFSSALLVYVKVDDGSKVGCKTLGEVFIKQSIIRWPAPIELKC